MAVRRRAPDDSVSLWTRRPESVRTVQEIFPECRVSSNLEDATRDAAVVVLCTSPESIQSIGRRLPDLLPSEAVVTDAGSIKCGIVECLDGAFAGRFVGAHPMAGSEQSGLTAAHSDLFENAVCILTPTGKSLPRAVATVRDFWRMAGCRTVEMSPEDHDRAIATVSHLPHATAAALMNAASASGADVPALAGGGFRDTTRIAAGSPGMWTEILAGNAANISTSIDSLISGLQELQAALRAGDHRAISTFLEDASAARQKLRHKS
jgi:prephenate dehydrogenase